MAPSKKRKRSSATMEKPLEVTEHTAASSAPLKKRKLSADSAASIMEPEDTTVADEVTDTDTIAVPQFKEDINAFSVPIDEEADFISRMPSEVLDEILSYLALDHDPDRAVKKHAAETTKGYYYEPSHVLLSVAAMSSRFRGHVEDFAQRQLTMHAEKYYFHSNEQLAERDNDKPRRRSERLKSKGVLETRCYRLELVRALQLQCMVCNRVTGYRDTMNNGVACCRNCARARSNETINLTKAKSMYELKDWMLISTRNPRLRAKHAWLPTINYGTVRTGTPYLNGTTISYRFWPKDVQMLAKAVYGNVEQGVRGKKDAKLQRRLRRRDKEHIAMKIRLYRDRIEGDNNPERKERNEAYLKYYTDPQCPETYASASVDSEYEPGYGYYRDVHKRLCVEESCRRCRDITKRQYLPLDYKDCVRFDCGRQYLDSDDDSIRSDPDSDL